MNQPYEAWLTSLANAKRGGFAISPIDRGLAYDYTLDFDSDVSADTFEGALRAAPVSDPTVTTALAEFTVTVGTFADGVTPVTFSLTETQVEALPADADGDAVHTLYWDILRTPSGGSQYRFAAGYVEILGGVTDDDA